VNEYPASTTTAPGERASNESGLKLFSFSRLKKAAVAKNTMRRVQMIDRNHMHEAV
jgi:hypothetical protein